MSRPRQFLGIGATLFLAAGSLTARSSYPVPLESPAKAQSQTCLQTANNQLELNRCTRIELQQAEARLAALLKRLRIDPNSPEEKAWEAYRDAQLKAIYPPVSDARVEYGSVYPMCLMTLKRKLIESRIRDLKALTISEGDDCLGCRVGGMQ
jgi:uncharacterized protein YecT (DUF1311 family)